jgi:hypothetical protein
MCGAFALAVAAVCATSGVEPVRAQSSPASRAARARGCEALPAASGSVTTAGPRDASRLAAIVRDARSGTTILLRDGTYPLDEAPLRFARPGVTLRSASGQADRVILDGRRLTAEAVVINASDVTIADVTIARAVDHLVHVVANGSTVSGTRLHGLRLLDAGEQFVKVNPGADRAYADHGLIECSSFELTEAGRSQIETLGGRSCYTGGIDVHGGAGWIVRGNRFEALYCRTGFLAEHAIHFWMGSRDTLVEHNTIVNCARGIGFGLGPQNAGSREWPGEGPPAGYVGHLGGIIRNNVIYADVPEYDTGIGLEQAWGARVLHNTVYATGTARSAFSSIDARFGNTRATIVNNLINVITARQNATVDASRNLEGAEASLFVDAAAIDLHLRADAAAAIDQGLAVDDAGVDMDGDPRGSAPDIGADEWRSGSRRR